MTNTTRILGIMIATAGVVVCSTLPADAAITWLPDYLQGQMVGRKENVGSNSPTGGSNSPCGLKGWYDSKPDNQVCIQRSIPGATCWECECESAFMYDAGYTCPAGKKLSQEKCNDKYKCVDCTNEDIKCPDTWEPTTSVPTDAYVALAKKNASGASFGCNAYCSFKCKSGYTAATPKTGKSIIVGGWSPISSAEGWKVEEYNHGPKNTDNTHLCQKMVKKTCADYGYLDADNPEMGCKAVPAYIVNNSSAKCYECIECDKSIYKYTSSNCPSPKILGGETCGQRYTKCACPETTGLSCDNGCKTYDSVCPNICTECKPCANACTIVNEPNSQIYTYTKEACSGRYCITGCRVGIPNLTENTWYKCWLKPAQ